MDASCPFVRGEGRVSLGGNDMRDSTKTIKHAHLRLPSIKDLKEWAERVFNSDRTVDAALVTISVMLCGWLVYCLSRAVSEGRYLM